MTVVMVLGAILAVSAGIMVADRAIRSTPFGVGLILASFALTTALARQTSVFVGGTRLSFTDLVSVVILTAATARLLRSRPTRVQSVLILLLAVLALSLMRGVVEFGAQSALNEFRSFLRYFGVAFYVSTITPSETIADRLGRLWLVLAVLLLPLLVLRWMNRFLGLPIGMLDARYDAPIRVLDGPDSFFYAEALLIALPVTAVLGVRDRRIRLLLTGVLVLVNLALNRRTAFAALLVAVAALALRNARVRHRLGKIAVGLAVMALAVALFASPEETTDEAASEEALGQSATDTGTLEWRIDGWSHLIRDHFDRGVTDVVLGQPMGAGYERQANERTVESNPHNWYIQVFLRSGLIGLASLLGLYGTAIVRFARAARRSVPSPPSTFDMPTLWTLLLLEAVWYTAWPPHQLQGVVLGVAIAILGRSRAALVPSQQPLIPAA